MDNIDFEAKTDRELLLLVAQKSNETTAHLVRMNGKLDDHEKRINVLESTTPHCGEKRDWKMALKVNWQTLSILGSLIAVIILGLIDKL